MGRENSSGMTGVEGFRVPIVREPSVNDRPSVSEVTRKPDAYEGMIALGNSVVKLAELAKPKIEHVLTRLNRERVNSVVDLGHRDPEKINMALVEDVDAGLDEGLEGVAELESHADILEQRVNGRNAIIAELEEMGRDE
jgi:hypothetical protein